MSSWKAGDKENDTRGWGRRLTAGGRSGRTSVGAAAMPRRKWFELRRGGRRRDRGGRARGGGGAAQVGLDGSQHLLPRADPVHRLAVFGEGDVRVAALGRAH